MSAPGAKVVHLPRGAADAHGMNPNTWQAATSAYVLALTAAGRSPGTVRLHRHYLRHLARHAPRPWTARTSQLVAALAVPAWSPETRKSARGAIVAFYRWAHLAGHVETDPALGLPTVRVPEGMPRPAPEDVVLRALSYAPRRERLMLTLAAYAGLRCCEIARVHSADLVGDVLRVDGKGGRVREVPILVPELVAAIRDAHGWLFPSPCGGPLTAGHVSHVLADALPEGWTAHTLRHRFATRAYAGTRDLLAVGRLLGHARPETTRRYVRLPDDALRAAVLAAAA